jgi:hypothetical protein
MSDNFLNENTPKVINTVAPIPSANKPTIERENQINGLTVPVRRLTQLAKTNDDYEDPERDDTYD